MVIEQMIAFPIVLLLRVQRLFQFEAATKTHCLSPASLK